MYAMLTGTLPFTVEPFSLRALYQKMVDKEMNPFPTQLSTGNQKECVQTYPVGWNHCTEFWIAIHVTSMACQS